MKRIAAFSVAIAIVAAGVLTNVLFLVLVLSSDDISESAETYGSLASIGCIAVLAGAILLTGLLIGNGRAVRLPFYWLGLIAFILLVGIGLMLNFLDLPPVAAPYLAVSAAFALAIFYAGLLLRWSTTKSQSVRAVVNPMVFGMTGSVVLAVSLQILFVGAILAGIFVGFTIAGAEIPNADRVQELFAEFEEGSGSLPDALFTPTVVFAAFALFVIVAPLTEEFTKFLGASIPFLKHDEFSTFTIFFAGSMAGLGFATTENIGYALLSPSAWAPTMLLRAPVVLIHMAASSIVALGWLQQRRTRRLSFVCCFFLAVALHGSFNAVAVSLTFLAGSLGSEATPSAMDAVLLLLLLGAAGAILTGSLAWLMLNARRFGKLPALRSAAVSESGTTMKLADVEPYMPSLTGRAVSSTLN